MFAQIVLRIKLMITYLRNHQTFPITRKRKMIFLFLGADYGNLGDVAITYAQIHFLKKRYPEYSVMEIPISKTFEGIKAVKRIITNDDIVTLIGGGNVSDLYDDIEFLRQMVIWNFRKHKIISFPQTSYFSRSLKGWFTQTTIKWVYPKAEQLSFMAREGNTFKIMRKILPHLNVEKMPDIVMTLDERRTGSRNGLLVCLRSDKEKSKNNTLHEKILSQLSEQYHTITWKDTQVDGINEANRFEELKQMWQIFASHEVVLTNRLHGMIFAYITGTPAYVIDNSTHKISACYDWIKECGYIKLITSSKALEPIKTPQDIPLINSKIVELYNSSPCLRFH